mmetsp:Transcript_124698/g.216085  ORF Transcript_124698/g.216085 Transcript_124698/m.216085 type:complete len:714 (+) Transcript_124698:58-2199(+)
MCRQNPSSMAPRKGQQFKVRAPCDQKVEEQNSTKGKSSKCLPGATCLSSSCIQSVVNNLLSLLFDCDGVRHDGIDAQWDLPALGKKPRPMVQSSGLPLGWRESRSPDSLSTDCNSSDTGDMAGSFRRSMPSCPSMPLICDTELNNDSNNERGFERLLSPSASIDDQLVELIVSQGQHDFDVASLTHATVVFEQEQSEYALQWNSELESWTMMFSLTGMPAGIHKFHFRANGDKVLSNRYAVAGNSNIALFSDSLRRYIISCSERAAWVREASGLTVESDDMSRATSQTRATDNNDWSRQSSPTSFLSSRQSSPTSFLSSRQSSPVQFQTGMNPVHESSIQEQDIGPSLWVTPKCKDKLRRRSHTVGVLHVGDDDDGDDLGDCFERDQLKPFDHAYFSEDVYESLYDAELRLRLDAQALRFDWNKAPIGGSCRNVQFWAGSCRMGKQTSSTCEDACFVSAYALGVADGVGGMSAYAGYGVNSAQYAADIMQISARSTADSARGQRSKEAAMTMAVEAMHAAEEGVQSFGATTATVACVDGDELGVANLGDSGFLLIRREQSKLEIVARSSEQHHRWNCPYQLANLPPALASKFPEFATDTAADCDTYGVTLQAGDLLLLFTDGVRDNLHDHEILHLVECALPPAVAELVGLPRHKTSPESIAQALTFAAYERSSDPRARVPFGDYCREHGYDLEGGKEDDITVVAAWVVQDLAP